LNGVVKKKLVIMSMIFSLNAGFKGPHYYANAIAAGGIRQRQLVAAKIMNIY
jgi:hypothetical protein